MGRTGLTVVARLGGLPMLPDGVEWSATDGGGPYAYVAELDCAALAAYDIDAALPRRGRLAFFCDMEGDDFAVVELREGVAVAPRHPPSEVESFGEGRFAAVPVVTFPNRDEHPALRGLDLGDDAFLDALDDRVRGPLHQVGGYPAAIQGLVEPLAFTCLLQVDSDDTLDIMWGDGESP